MRTARATLEGIAARSDMELLSAKLARLLDQEDPLRRYREEFHFPVDHRTGKPYRYFCGNSLGLQHVGVEEAVRAETAKWREQAVEGHFLQPNPWFEIDDILREDMAAVVGALPSEVVVMSSLTVNLHFLLTAFYRPEGQRRKILCESNPFPSDTHAFVSQILNHGGCPESDLVFVGSAAENGEIISTEKFLEAIEANKDSLALVLLSGVHFLTGQFFDLPTIAAAAHRHGIPFGVDLAHAVGNVPLRLHDWGIDFACWCTYKYLNGGPGNIGGLFVHAKHTDQRTDGDCAPGRLENQRVLHGWWGHQRANRFRLGTDFEPSPGAARFQLSNPCVLSIASLQPSLRLCASIGLERLRAKSVLLTGYLELLIDAKLSHALRIVSPRDEAQRGAQLSIRILPNRVKSKVTTSMTYENGTNVDSDALVVQKQLLEAGVICDNRPPDFVRLSPVPTYNSFEDVFALVETLAGLFVDATEAQTLDSKTHTQ